MSKYIYFLIFCISLQVQGQSFFKKNASINTILSSDQRVNKPLKETFFNLDISALKDYVIDIGGKNSQEESLLILPDTEGNFKHYYIYESSVMDSEFQANYPNIRSYKGQGITNPQETIRFTISNLGFEAIILNSTEGTLHIKPYDLSKDLYSAYLNKDINFDNNSFECELIELGSSPENELTKNTSLNANDGLLRDYRIAISATAEYSAFYNSNLSEVISAMTVAVSNVNAVLERDLSVTLTMVDNTSLIFFNPATDPFDNFDNIALLQQNQNLIDNFIGNNNYDIGHVFNTAGGGVAALQSSCVQDFKAYGVTGATSATDSRFLFVLLHELGHQFGSPHTFNGSEGPCGTNISPSTALEPGSGSTIMAYPGLCAPQNVIESAAGDLYYHQISLSRMWNHILISGSCPEDQTATGNSAPLADAGSDYLIPQGTPYKLVGNSLDPDGTSTHTYTWEQYDFGPAGAPTETTVSGPLVRSFEGTNNPIRYVPNLIDLLSFQGSQVWERLVTVDRDITFRLTVRDNDILGGQTAFDQMTATVTTGAGPFQVTSQNVENSIVWTPGTTETITWDVAGTDENEINESSVNILLSTDGGLTYDTILASGVPNDGSQEITVPNIDEPRCRLMVEAADNIFFNINAEFFAIGDYIYGEGCQDFVFNIDSVIPESEGTASTMMFEINEVFEISDLNVNINVSGNADNSSLFFTLRPPFDQSNFYDLIVYQCNETTGIDLTFDDEGVPLDCLNIDDGEEVLPSIPLSYADGQNSQGNWTLLYGDIFEDENTSTLNSLTFTICSTQAIPSLSNQNFESLSDISLYPNPNNGEFSIQLNTNTSEDIQIEVFDVVGRLVHQENFENIQSRFETSLSLDQPNSGLYLVKISQGKTSVVKKLIVR